MNEEKIAGLGGVGDCLIIIFKLLERENQNYEYFHLATSEPKVKMCKELLNNFKIKHKMLSTTNPVQLVWPMLLKKVKFDKLLNVFAEGHIKPPKQPHHWEPCTDEGFSQPFAQDEIEKKDRVIVQVNATIEPPPEKLLSDHGKVYCPEGRHFSVRPLVDYVRKTYPDKEVWWVGTDKNFKCDFGYNVVGCFSLSEVFKEIAASKHFVGFNSVLLYWALRNKVKCTLFPDHQGRNDMRIHSEWKKYINYYDEEENITHHV
jgi:hypothetical protein